MDHNEAGRVILAKAAQKGESPQDRYLRMKKPWDSKNSPVAPVAPVKKSEFTKSFGLENIHAMIIKASEQGTSYVGRGNQRNPALVKFLNSKIPNSGPVSAAKHNPALEKFRTVSNAVGDRLDGRGAGISRDDADFLRHSERYGGFGKQGNKIVNRAVDPAVIGAFREQAKKRVPNERLAGPKTADEGYGRRRQSKFANVDRLAKADSQGGKKLTADPKFAASPPSDLPAYSRPNDAVVGSGNERQRKLDIERTNSWIADLRRQRR